VKINKEFYTIIFQKEKIMKRLEIRYWKFYRKYCRNRKNNVNIVEKYSAFSKVSLKS